MPFEQFRPPLLKVVRRSDSSKGGRPGLDVVLKFRIVVLQSLSRQKKAFRYGTVWHGCGSAAMPDGDAVPDVNTLWDLREALIKAGRIPEE